MTESLAGTIARSAKGAPSRAETRRRHSRWLAFGVGAAAFALVIAITGGAGPGLDPDSMSYVGAATSLAHEGTLRVPSSLWDDDDSTVALSTWPPGFSAAMALPQTLGASRLSSARIVLATAALVTAAVLFLLLQRAAGRAAALTGVTAVFVTPAIVGVHLSVLSEPLFLACLTLTLTAMLARSPQPLLTAIPATAAAMVRYAGVCAPAAVVLWFLFAHRKPLRRRFVDAGLAALPPTIALALWMARTAIVSNGEGGAELALYGNFGPTLRQAARTIVDWLAPGIEPPMLGPPLALLICLAMGAAIVKVWKRLEASSESGNQHARDFLRADTLLLSCYLAVLLSARTLVGDAIPFDFRLFAPFILLAEAAIVVVVARFLSGSGRPVRVATLAIAAVWLAASARVSALDAHDAVTTGYDFASSDWRSSPTLDWVRSKSAGWTLFSNWPPAMYFWTNRIARDIPQSLDTADLREFREILRKSHGAFVAFESYNTDYPPSDSLANALSLVELARFPDGKVWVSRETEPK